MSKQWGQLDSRIEIVTPENIAFQYRIAGPFRRAPAYAIDLLIQVGVLLVAQLLLVGVFGAAGLAGIGIGLLLVLWFVLSWFYGGLFETFWNGQTPGKWAVGIRVVSIQGQPIDALQAVLRNVLRAADALPLTPLPMLSGLLKVIGIPLYQLGLWVPAFNQRFQRLGDLASGTMVIVEEGRWTHGVVRVTEPEAIRLAGILPTNLQVGRSLARTLSMYVQRRGGFSAGRRVEIARQLAEPLAIKFNLPAGVNPDLLLCAFYYRAFIADQYAEQTTGSGRVPPLPVATPSQARETDLAEFLS